MASYSSNLNPSVVKTELDGVFYQEFDGTMHPRYASALDSSVFQQGSADSSAVIWEQFKGVGYWDERAEEENVPEGNPRIDNQKTFSVVNYSKSVDIPKNMFDDAKHDAVNKMIRDFAETARITRDRNAFAVFRNGFTTATTADDVALFSNSHVALSGNTVDNLLTDALDVDALESAITMLSEQEAQDGTIRGHMPGCLLVPPALFREAIEITKSELVSDTADNAINFVSSEYGIAVKTSPFLGAAAGGSDTAWFLLSKNHSVYRFERQAVQTKLVDWIYQRNNNYIYKGEYREVVGAMSWEGIVGSNGTT